MSYLTMTLAVTIYIPERHFYILTQWSYFFNMVIAEMFSIIGGTTYVNRSVIDIIF